MAAAFPPVDASWLAWFGLVPFLALIAWTGSYGEAAWCGWFAGTGFSAVLAHWLVPALGGFAVLAYALAGVFWLPVALAGRAVLRSPPTPGRVLVATAVLPSVWVTTEAVRSWQHLGGPWGLFGSTQWQVRPVLAVAALGGVWLLSFLLVAVNVGVFGALRPDARLPVRAASLGLTCVLAGAAVLFGLTRPEPAVTGRLTVAGVQPGDVQGAAKRLDAHLRLTHTLAPYRPDVVVWGQSSASLNPALRPDVDIRLRRAARSAGGDLLINVDARGPGGEITKTTWQYRPDGVVAVYAKRRLVPFGEYIPLRPVLGWLSGMTGATDIDRMTGDIPVTMTIGSVKVGPLISYESIFPDMRRELARMGAEVTVVQGSLTTFQGSWAHAQQASLEALRAVETGRPAVLVELSGTSAAFDPRGRRLAWVPPGTRQTFVVDVPLSREDTPYVRHGDWVLAASGAVTAGWLLLRRRRGTEGDPARRPRPCADDRS
jgi:apolipoprotein N-acyltransferase